MDKNNRIKPDRYEGLSVLRPPRCFELTGKRFELVMDDGYDKNVIFRDKETLLFGPEGEEEAMPYDCLKIADDCYFVNFEKRPFSNSRCGITLILDLRESLVTAGYATLGRNPKIPTLPSVDLVVGAIRRPDGTVPAKRHGYTDEMAGTSIDWNYGSFNIAHVYYSEHYYRVSFTPRAMERVLRNNPQMMAGGNGERPRRPEGPRASYEDYGEYIKIRDDLYVVSLLESNLARANGHGNSLLFLMNLDEMHDVGRSFGTTIDREPENYTFGAFGTVHDATEVKNMPSMYYLH